MRKSLYEYVAERFEANLPSGKEKNELLRDTFERTLEQIGFDAYRNYASFMAVRRRRNRESGKK